MPLREGTPATREGPHTYVVRSCHGCRYLHGEYYVVQGDSGFDYTCEHPSQRGTHVATPSKTPDWCWFLRAANTTPARPSDGSELFCWQADPDAKCDEFPNCACGDGLSEQRT